MYFFKFLFIFGHGVLLQHRNSKKPGVPWQVALGSSEIELVRDNDFRPK